MKTKESIVENWLPRYTGKKLENFEQCLLLTNFSNYVQPFAAINKAATVVADRQMRH
jgi:AMP nucleosidase